MKILVVASGNSKTISPFIIEQVESLKNLNIYIEYFFIEGKGWAGYLKNIFYLKRKIRNKNFNLIHAHYGLSGLLATLQRKIPVIITFHGSDINISKNYKWSFIASRLSKKNIFVHKDQHKKLKISLDNKYIIPCGINLKIFCPKNRKKSRNILGWNQNKVYILFSSSFDNPVKNIDLARKSIQNLKNTKLVELKGYNKTQLANLMNAADLLLVTSFSETGPLVVKEAAACHCPIVSTDVGDVKKVIRNLKNSHITNYNVKEINNTIKKIINSKNQNQDNRLDLSDYSLEQTAKKIKKVYQDSLESPATQSTNG